MQPKKSGSTIGVTLGYPVYGAAKLTMAVGRTIAKSPRVMRAMYSTAAIAAGDMKQDMLDQAVQLDRKTEEKKRIAQMTEMPQLPAHEDGETSVFCEDDKDKRFRVK